MARTEFKAAVKRAALARADGRCEGIISETGERCPCFLSFAKYAFDHVIADQLGGKADLSNCQVLCTACHTAKTARDAALIATAKRRADAHAGTARARKPIRSAGFPKPGPRHTATGRIPKLDLLYVRPRP